MNKYQRHYMKKKLAGICVHNGCKEPCGETSVFCVTHLSKNAEAAAKWKRSHGRKVRFQERMRYAQRVEAGFCGDHPGRPLVSASKCRECLDDLTARRKATSRAPALRCSVCRKTSHNKSKCPEEYLARMRDVVTSQPKE